LDVADSLPTFMVDGLSDPVRLTKDVRHLMAEAVKAATEKHLHVAVG